MYTSLRKQRMARCFIDATYEMIMSGGIKNVSNRGVASVTGYNSATIYNYFENLDHLVFMASMKFITPYLRELGKITEDTKDPLDRVIKIWDSFSSYSFEHPDAYRSIFFAKVSRDLDVCFRDYYILYPEDIVTPSPGSDCARLFSSNSTHERGRMLLEDCAEAGYIKHDEIKEINDKIYLIYEGMLFRVIRKKHTPEEAEKLFHEYLTHLLGTYRQDLK